MALLWILTAGLAMSAIALIGGLTTVLHPDTLARLLLPMVALAAGSLLGGAMFHLIPAGAERLGSGLLLQLWVVAGFVVFFVLEQFLHWHHCHDPGHRHRQPVTYLILIADGAHNFIGGVAVGAAFTIDLAVGQSAWLAAAAHEVPQELGDFGVLMHGGWTRGKALLANFLSALTFPLGGLAAWWAADRIDVAALLPFAAGNFLCIAAADLIPEVKRQDRPGRAAIHLACLLGGIALLLLLRLGSGEGGA